jgi:hypothetical protein
VFIVSIVCIAIIAKKVKTIKNNKRKKSIIRKSPSEEYLITEV